MIVIIGTGLAGYQLARELRRVDQTSELTLITNDDGRFYPKPQLSIAMTSKKTAESLVTSTASAMSSQLNAVIRTHSKVLSIDPIKKTISLSDETISYSKLILACGADVINPNLTGNAVKEVLSINHLYHYSAFQEFIKNKKHITVLGAGLIGCEFANDLTNAGYKVDVISLAKTPLDLLLPEKIGKLLQHALEKNGVTFHFENTAKNVDKINSHLRLTLSNGNFLETEFILSAIGLKPHIELAKSGNIATNRGVLVNRYLETNVADIYALGDCAEVEGHVLPYIAPILNCAKALAKTLAGERTAVEYPAMPVIVKTPSHPIAVCPPPKDMLGEWKIEENDNNVRALFFNTRGELFGFVLTNDAVKERAALAKQLPGLF